MSAFDEAMLPALASGGDLALPEEAAGMGALSNAQRAALVIAALGPEAAGPIIERIDDKHLRAFARAYAHFQRVPRSTLTAVVEDFVQRLSSDESDDLRGGFEETRELLSQFISSDNITRLMEDINVPGGESIWDKLARTPDQVIADYLAKQNLQLVALVLMKVNTEQASRIIDLFDTDLASKVVLRLAKPISVSPEAMQIVSDALSRDFLSGSRDKTKGRNPGEMIGSMMNNVATKKRETLLEFIESNMPGIMTDVKKSMLTFQDIATRVPPNAIPVVVRQVDEAIFLQAAKFGKQNAPSCVDFIFANISQRMAQQYEEQMEKMKKVSVKESETAQATFMAAVRKLAAAGEFELIEESTGEDEEEGEDEA